MSDATENNDAYEIITPSSNNASGSMMATVVKAEIDQQISTAKQYPRSIKQFINDATEMCTLNESIAESCNYGLPRGGKIIEGASVRFAEIILSAWGNCRAGARIVHEDSRFITAQGICHDLQTNTMITMEVQRRITDSKGKTYKDDMVGVTGNAAASIALRNAILRKVPKAFWEPIYMKSRDVALGVSKPMANRRADALAIMLKFGVTQEMILAKFEIKGVEDLTIEHLAQLNAAKVSIKEGIVTAEAFFAPPTPPAQESKGNEAVKAKLTKKATKEEKAIAAGADPKTGELPADKKPEGKITKAADLHPGEDPGISEAIVKPSDPVFNTNLIPAKGKKDDATTPDFESWQAEWFARCEVAPTSGEIARLYKNNAGILAQMRSRAPDTYEECEHSYANNCKRLEDIAAMNRGE